MRIPSMLRTIASAVAETPWRDPGVFRWWTFVRARASRRGRRTALDLRPEAAELRVLSVVVDRARPVLPIVR